MQNKIEKARIKKKECDETTKKKKSSSKLTLHGKYACVDICVVTLLMPLPSRYGPVMNVVPWLIESDEEFPSARIKSGGK